MLATFVESKTGTNRSEIENASKFLTDQINNYEKQLRDAERRRADFRSRYIDVLPGGWRRGEPVGGAERGRSARLQGQLQDALARRETLTQGLAEHARRWW